MRGRRVGVDVAVTPAAPRRTMSALRYGRLVAADGTSRPELAAARAATFRRRLIEVADLVPRLATVLPSAAPTPPSRRARRP